MRFCTPNFHSDSNLTLNRLLQYNPEQMWKSFKWKCLHLDHFQLKLSRREHFQQKMFEARLFSAKKVWGANIFSQNVRGANIYIQRIFAFVQYCTVCYVVSVNKTAMAGIWMKLTVTLSIFSRKRLKK